MQILYGVKIRMQYNIFCDSQIHVVTFTLVGVFCNNGASTLRANRVKGQLQQSLCPDEQSNEQPVSDSGVRHCCDEVVDGGNDEVTGHTGVETRRKIILFLMNMT